MLAFSSKSIYFPTFFCDLWTGVVKLFLCARWFAGKSGNFFFWNYSVLFPLISFWSYTHLISGCHCSTWKNFVVIDYDPTYICREKMSKIEKNVFLRDSYLQLMLIYLHLSYNGRRCHQHLYLDLMEQQYRLKIFCMCLQDMAHLTMWESVHIWTFCLFNVRFSTKCLLVQCSSSMLVDVPISINWHLEPE